MVLARELLVRAEALLHRLQGSLRGRRLLSMCRPSNLQKNHLQVARILGRAEIAGSRHAERRKQSLWRLQARYAGPAGSVDRDSTNDAWIQRKLACMRAASDVCATMYRVTLGAGTCVRTKKASGSRAHRPHGWTDVRQQSDHAPTKPPACQPGRLSANCARAA